MKPTVSAALLLALLPASAVGQEQGAIPAKPIFITLGTGSGPVPNPDRAQPANLLLAGDQAILIDVGDGAAQQIGKALPPLFPMNTLFISHLHFDHIGGLYALIARRHQLAAPGILTIYGPRGTAAIVRDLEKAMKPGAAGVRAINGEVEPEGAHIKVVEIINGWTGNVGAVRVRAASNSHYKLLPVTDSHRDETFAFRFEVAGKSFVYTGDTGPSDNVEALARDADVLVTEVGDTGQAISNLRRFRSDLSAARLDAIGRHFAEQHLSPREVGLLAKRAGVKSVVVTHNPNPAPALDEVRKQIAETYSGPVRFAADLDRF